LPPVVGLEFVVRSCESVDTTMPATAPASLRRRRAAAWRSGTAAGAAATAAALCLCGILCGQGGASPPAAAHAAAKRARGKPASTCAPPAPGSSGRHLLRSRTGLVGWIRLRGGAGGEVGEGVVGDAIHAAAAAAGGEGQPHAETATGLRFFCGTWNVNGRPPLVAVEDWLARSERDDVDVYVIALQEVQELSGTAALLTDEEKGRPWSAVLQQAVGAPTQFRCLAVRQMVGCYITLLARASLCDELSAIKVGELGTGFLNSGGNKGGVAVRFEYRGISVCAVCAHLAAQVSEVKRRNQDIRVLLSRLHFVDPSILPPLKAQDIYDCSTGDEDQVADEDEGDEERGEGAMPDVYDSPCAASKMPARTASPLVLDGSDEAPGAARTAVRQLPAAAEKEGVGAWLGEAASGEDSSLPTYAEAALTGQQAGAGAGAALPPLPAAVSPPVPSTPQSPRSIHKVRVLVLCVCGEACARDGLPASMFPCSLPLFPAPVQACASFDRSG